MTGDHLPQSSKQCSHGPDHKKPTVLPLFYLKLTFNRTSSIGV